VNQVVELAEVAVTFAGDRDGGDATPLRAAEASDVLLGADHHRDRCRDLSGVDALEEVLEAGALAREQHADTK
jgi:hypothetical protein